MPLIRRIALLGTLIAVAYLLRDRGFGRRFPVERSPSTREPAGAGLPAALRPETPPAGARGRAADDVRQGRRNMGARVVALVTMVAIGTALILKPVSAVPYVGPPILEVDPTSAAEDSAVSVTGRGFVPHDQGVLALDGDSTGMPAYRVRGNGSFEVQLVIPQDTAVGPHEIVALGPEAIARITLTVIGAPTAVPTASDTSLPTAPATAPPTQVPTAAPTTAATPGPTPVPTSLPTPMPTSSVDHVFLILMENHAYGEVWNNASTPYTTLLANANARADNYFAITHPSLPNYLDLFSGSDYGITTDCDPSSSCHVDAASLADNLEAARLTWRGYFEDMPAPCQLTDFGGYIAHHNPFIYFDDIRNDPARCGARVVNYMALSLDIAAAATTPNFSMLVPNNCHDTHDCSIATGDAWLAANVPALLSSPACVIDTCLVVLTWDEDDGTQGNNVLTVFAGSAAATGAVSSARYDHFDVLRTIEDLLGVKTQTTNDGSAVPMRDLLH